MFNIRMGIPEMEALWYRLQTGHRNGTNRKKDEDNHHWTGAAPGRFKKWSI
jgi:hypothetical protein